MEWSDEDVDAAENARAEAEEVAYVKEPHADKWRVGVAAIMTRAVELAAARGGTMTAETVSSVLNAIKSNGWPMHSEPLSAHISAQGARVAVLEAEREDYRNRMELAQDGEAERDRAMHEAQDGLEQARAELDALKPSGQVAEDMEAVRQWVPNEAGRATRALSRLAAQAQRAETAQRDAAHWQARVDAAHEELADVGPTDGDLCTKIRVLVAECASLRESNKNLMNAGHWLSEHADKTAGEVSDGAHNLSMPSNGSGLARYPCSPTCTHDDAARPGHHERVKERSAEMRKAALSDYAKQKNDWRPADADAYDAGAEAMRTACGQIVAEEFITDGLDRSVLHKRIMERMEGAVP